MSSKQVYMTLTGALLAAALGSYVNMRTGFGGTLGILGFIGCSLALSLIPASPANGTKRLGLLAGAAFSQGTSLGPLINVAFYLYPG